MIDNTWKHVERLGRKFLLQFIAVAAALAACWALIHLVRDCGGYWQGESRWILVLLNVAVVAVFGFLFHRLFIGRPFRRGMWQYSRGKYVKAAMEFERAIDELHVGAAVMLGEMYLDGVGIPRNATLGVETMRLALANYYFVCRLLPKYRRKWSLSAPVLGIIMRDQTPRLAADWMVRGMAPLERAAAAGNQKAMELLRDMYAMKNFPRYDSEKSVEYARLASERSGSAEADIALAMSLIDKPGATRVETEEGERRLEAELGKGSLYAGWLLLLQYADGDNPHLAGSWEKAIAFFGELLDKAEQVKIDPERLRVYVETFTDLLYANGKMEFMPPGMRKRAEALLGDEDLL